MIQGDTLSALHTPNDLAGEVWVRPQNVTHDTPKFLDVVNKITITGPVSVLSWLPDMPHYAILSFHAILSHIMAAAGKV